MIKQFCDICDLPADIKLREGKIFTTPLKCDGGAKIDLRIKLGFVSHSMGFGGPPDLCKACYKLLLLTFLEEI